MRTSGMSSGIHLSSNFWVENAWKLRLFLSEGVLPMQPNALFKSVLLFALLALLVAGCGPATTPSSVQPPDEEKTAITIVIPEDPPSFNPSVGDTGYDALVLNLVMLGLTGIDPDGNIYPELAAELPTTENGSVVVDDAAGTMSVTWKLRSDVVWSDGTPFSADDVVFTWSAITNPETVLWVRGVDYVESVEKLDTHTVRFNYNSIYPGYLVQLGGEQLAVWPAHYCDPEQGYVAWDCARKPISTGPFVLTDWAVGEQMVFERNQKYFEPGKPSIDKITIKIVPDDAVMKQMMLNGDADIYMWVSETIAESFKETENVKVSLSPTNRWVLRLWPNRAARGEIDPVAHPHPIFADAAVRQAIRMAIDVDTVIKTAFRGYSQPVWTEFHREPYKCDLARPEYNLEKAAAMLEAAGWKDLDGDGVRECHGCKNAEEGYVMKAELATYPDYGEPMVLAHQLIAEMLKKVGMQLDLVTIEGNIMWSDFASGGTEQTGNFDIDMYDDGYSGIDPTDYLHEQYYSQSAIPDNGLNVVRYQNKKVDELLQQAYTLDENVRKDVFCQMATIFDQELPNIPLLTIINADAHSARLENILSNGNDVVSWNAANWKVVK